jgi:hypothetical protein
MAPGESARSRFADGRVRRLSEAMDACGVSRAVAERILEGGEAVGKTSTAAGKADWLRGAMLRMDRLIAPGTRRTIREACACCLGGRRRETARRIARENATLEDRIRACDRARDLFGHSVELLPDGKVKVCFFPEGRDTYRCPCLPKAEGVFPPTYCQCCCGHVKHHLQTALGRRVGCEVVSSVLTSGGTRPCSFVCTVDPEGDLVLE